jgi:D-alanine transaminase
MSRIAFVNGQYLPFKDATVHVEDRGFQFADSIYEVFAVSNGRCLDEEGHWARLERSLGELGQGMPMSRQALAGHVAETVRRNRVKDGIAYLQVTRGVAKRDHAFPAAGLLQTVVITARRIDRAKAEATASAGIAVMTVPDIRWERCDIKTTALIPNVLAKQAARSSGAYEAWLVGPDGLVTEGSSTNTWIVDADGHLRTPGLSNAILPGVTRQTVMRLAAERQLAVLEQPFTVAEAQGAREAFITSAGAFVTPVVKIDGVMIGDGRPGPVAKSLRVAYLREVALR